MRPFLLPALLGVAMLLGYASWPSGLWHRVTDPHFTFVSWADTKSGLEILSELSDQAASQDPAFTIYPGDLLPSGLEQDDMDRWKVGFVAVEVNGPLVAVTFYQLGSTEPVHTIRFAKER